MPRPNSINTYASKPFPQHCLARTLPSNETRIKNSNGALSGPCFQLPLRAPHERQPVLPTLFIPGFPKVILTLSPRSYLLYPGYTYYVQRTAHRSPSPTPPPGRDLVAVGVHARGLRAGDDLPETAAQAAAACSDVLSAGVSFTRRPGSGGAGYGGAARGTLKPACMHGASGMAAGQLQGSCRAGPQPCGCRRAALEPPPSPRRRPRRWL